MKYRIDNDIGCGPEDHADGRTWEVVHSQPWEAGRYLPAVARGCTVDDARRICRLLNAEADIQFMLAYGVNDALLQSLRNHMTGF